MASPIIRIAKARTAVQRIPLDRRFLLVLLICCIQGLYIPTSNQTYGGVEPRLPIDVIPIWPVWVLPYILCYLLWLLGLLGAIFKMDDRLFRSFIAAFFITCTLAVSTFILFPTYVQAASIPGDDPFSSLLRFIHENWGRYDAFPSGHVYITVLLALFYHLLYPRLKLLWISIPVVVSLSTLFTGQHYIADIAAGLLFALIGFHGGILWAGFSPLQKPEVKPRLLQPPS